jgi:NADPH-dependent 2,4-dienoyl-CoA reductase/sulfur reductase-like enzyme
VLAPYLWGNKESPLGSKCGRYEIFSTQQVVAIDRDARVVRSASGHETHWDKLVLATGTCKSTCTL